MIKFYDNIPQAKFSIMITLYRAFAEDSRELLTEMDKLVFAVSHTGKIRTTHFDIDCVEQCCSIAYCETTRLQPA